MSVINRLERLTGERKPDRKKGSRHEEISELRKRIEAIMARRPVSKAQFLPPAAPQRKPLALKDLIDGEESQNASGTFFLVPGIASGTSRHGCRCIKDLSSIDMTATSLLANNPALAGLNYSDGLFLDTETTGLSGGTGTLCFLIGVGWFDGENFITRQIFARDFAEERASLVFLQELVKDKQFLVTFNGKAFDVGLLSARFIMNRLSNPLAGLPHLDLLHPSRRLIGHRLGSSSLASLEEAILDFYRKDDLPGSEIPQRYFDWLRQRDARLMVDVFEHNRLDIISMAALACHLTGLMRHPADLENTEHTDLLAAARLFHDREKLSDARARLEVLTYSKSNIVKTASRRILSIIHKRAGRWDEAVRLWDAMLKEEDAGKIFALIELAKWCEHRAGDYNRAIILVKQAIDLTEDERQRSALIYRLNRLQKRRKDNYKI